MKYKLFLLLLLLVMPVRAMAFALSMPVACNYGTECFIQNYVDHDTDSGWQDYHCGALSYDGHKGTDFRIKDDVAMEHGVDVIAAIEGTVRGVRDGEVDRRVTAETREAIRNKECGNGIVTTHEGGYEVQYCHLKRGSIKVKAGDRVARGQVLGQIGLSGMTEFPHLDLSIRKEKTPIDPFTGGSFGGVCAGGNTPHSTTSGLWDKETAALLTYHSPVALGFGFSGTIVSKQDLEKAMVRSQTLSRDSKQLIFWAYLMGVRKGDRLLLSIATPEGMLLAQEQTLFDNNQAVYYQYIGKPYTASAIPLGTYSATIRLLREGKTVIEKRDKVKVQ